MDSIDAAHAIRSAYTVRASAPRDLTPRELDVLREMVQARGRADIAAHLHLSESSAGKHVNAIFTKLGLTTEDLSRRRVTAILAFLRDAEFARLISLKPAGTGPAGSRNYLVLPRAAGP